ncbi:hypothetical protein [Lentzea atacamensis]|uniref:hypothetical protein n=1 Tax=Lentzea atacamensis TaxID=531938 RepID=UPI0011BDB192|nr:hypothetical protein [Lentzea atacamensis]
MTSPLLAHAAMAPAAADASTTIGVGEGGWIEIVWAPQAQAEMDQRGATVEAIAPAELIERNGGRGIRFPVRSAQGDPSLSNPAHTQGTGVADGGLILRVASTEVRVTRLAGDVRDEQISGRYMVNDVDAGMQPVFRWRATEGDLAVVPGAPGKPVELKISDLPVRLTSEMLDLWTTSARSYGLPSLSADTVVAHVTAQGRFVPPTS